MLIRHITKYATKADLHLPLKYLFQKDQTTPDDSNDGCTNLNHTAFGCSTEWQNIFSICMGKID